MKWVNFCLILIFLVNPCFSQTRNVKIAEKRPSFGISASISYIIPPKSVFNKNYENRFPFTNGTFPPVGFVIGAAYRFTRSLDLAVDVGVRNQVLKKHEGIPGVSSLHVFPLSFLGRYIWQFRGGKNPYIGLGLAGYRARFASKMNITTNESGMEAIKTVEVNQNYFGYGLLFETGLMHRIFKNYHLDFGIRYDLTRVGNPEIGGLGNIGGAQLHLRVITYF